MSISTLLAQLFNLKQHTGALNSVRAAEDFWLVFGIGLIVLIAATLVRSPRRPTRSH